MFNLVDSVTSGHIVLEPESNNTITKRIIETYNPIFRPMSNVIKTESGYTVIIPPQNIGGTKVGALFGEAVVIKHPALQKDFRYMIKRQCALLAKGRLIPVQLKALFEGGKDSLYYELSKKENELAIKLAESVVKAGYKLWLPHQTNQVFVIVPNDKIEELNKEFMFYTWCPYDETNSVIRLVTSWGTTEEDIESLLKAL